MTQRISLLACVAAAVVLLGGCGDSDSDSPAERPAQPVKLSIATEQFAVTHGDIAELQGSVTPATSTVRVNGLSANVSGGTWTARVKLDELGEKRSN